MSELVFLLEEESAAEMLKGLMPRLAPSLVARYTVFEGKTDLEKQLVRRLRHYRVPLARFVVLHDQDSNNCKKLKASLVAKCGNAGRREALVRIACHELESWYLADLAAVEKGLKIPGLSRKQDQRKFRHPDTLANACQELEKLTNNRYQTVSGSRAIAPHLDLNNQRSDSFRVFIEGIRKITGATSPPATIKTPRE